MPAQNQTLGALLFLFREVLGRRVGWLDGLVQAKQPVRLPVVLSRPEVGAVLARVSGPSCLAASLLYGSGTRLPECLHLRVKDLDFERNSIHVRSGKGNRDRVTVLPAALRCGATAHLRNVECLLGSDLRQAEYAVALPTALEREYLGAGREWGWHWRVRAPGRILAGVPAYRAPPLRNSAPAELPSAGW